MRGFFINLADAAARRTALVAGFAAHRLPGWELARVEAVSAAAVEAAAVPGKLSWREKACFLSHRRALDAAAAVDGPSWIMEDDVAFGADSFRLIDAFTAKQAETGWDILFTDIGIADLDQGLRLIDKGRKFLADRQAGLLELQPVNFTAAASYVVAASAKAKLRALLAEDAAPDLPYDLFLCRAVRTGRLRAACIFPFATTLSELSDRSQVQPEDAAATDLPLAAFRRALWFNRDLAAQLPKAEALIRDNAEARLFGAVVGALLFAPHK